MSTPEGWAFQSWAFPCDDCGACVVTLGEYYMVHDALWAAAGNAMHLCIGCLEARLGRRLTPADFTGAPVNMLGRTSARMNARRGHGGNDVAANMLAVRNALVREESESDDDRGEE